MTGVLLFLTRAAATGRTWTHTRSAEAVLGAHAVEFSKTVAPSGVGGLPTQHARQAHAAPAGRTGNYSARQPVTSAGGAHEAHETPLANAKNTAVQSLRRHVHRFDRD